MKSIEYTKLGLAYLEIWFNSDLEIMKKVKSLNKKIDVVIFHESKVKISTQSRPMILGVLDLKGNIDELFESFDKGFRNESRRAAKENITCFTSVEEMNWDELYLHYTVFCKDKNIRPMSKSLLNFYKNNNALRVSNAFYGDKHLQTHVYFKDDDEVILLLSIPNSLEKLNVANKIFGWANRHLHWNDIKSFAEEGIGTYNLGGMGNPVTDENRFIVQFKKEMNPKDVTYYQDTQKTSWKAKLIGFFR